MYPFKSVSWSHTRHAVSTGVPQQKSCSIRTLGAPMISLSVPNLHRPTKAATTLRTRIVQLRPDLRPF